MATSNGEPSVNPEQSAVVKMKDDTLRVLDLTRQDVRDAIRDADDAEALYLSAAATNY